MSLEARSPSNGEDQAKSQAWFRGSKDRQYDEPSYQGEKIPVVDGAQRSGSVIPGEVLKHSHDADEAMKAIADREGVSLDIDEATNKRLLSKIDWHMLPVWPLKLGNRSHACELGVQR